MRLWRWWSCATVPATASRSSRRGCASGSGVLRADRAVAAPSRGVCGVIGGIAVAYRGELFKLLAQRRTWLGFATAAIGPIVYLLLELTQGPPHGPLTNNLGHTGVGYALVVVKLIAVFGPAVIAALVAGDIVAGERADGTLKTVLTRSLSRTELLMGKLLALFTYLALAMALFFVVSTIAGGLAWGFHPLLNIPGPPASAVHALGLDAISLVVYTLPVLAIASF